MTRNMGRPSDEDESRLPGMLSGAIEPDVLEGQCPRHC